MPSDPIDHAAATELAGRLKAVADPTRLQILSILQHQYRGGAKVLELVAALKRLAQPTVSSHLRILVTAGLVTRTQEGQYGVIRLAPGAVAELSKALRGGR